MTVSEVLILGDSTTTNGYLFSDATKRFDTYALSLLGAGGQTTRNRGKGGLRMADNDRYWFTPTTFTTTNGTFNYLGAGEYGGTSYNANSVVETQALGATIQNNSLVYVGHSVNDLVNSAPSDPPTGFPCAVEELTNVLIALNTKIKSYGTGIKTICGVPFGCARLMDNVNDSYTDLAQNYAAYGFDFCLNTKLSLLYVPPGSVTVTSITGNGTTAVATCSATLNTAQWIVGNNVTIVGNANGGFNVTNTTITAVSGATFSFLNATNATGAGGTASTASADINAADGTHPIEKGNMKMGLALASILANQGIGTMPKLYLNPTGLTNGISGDNAFTARDILNQINNVITAHVNNNNGTTLKRYSRAKYAANNSDFYYELPPGFLFDFNQNYLFATALNSILPNFTNYITTTAPVYSTYI